MKRWVGGINKDFWPEYTPLQPPVEAGVKVGLSFAIQKLEMHTGTEKARY